MAPAADSFIPFNLPPNSPLPDDMSRFSIYAPPNTDLWRKPPQRETSTAPLLCTRLRRPFVAAEVTVLADWELEWDQGGLVIFTGHPPGRNSSAVEPAVSAEQSSPDSESVPSPSEPRSSDLAGTAQTLEAPPPYPQSQTSCKWVKAGLEFSNNIPHASSVCATSEGADWALSPLSRLPNGAEATELRIKLERIGYALTVWFFDPAADAWPAYREPHLPPGQPPSSEQQLPTGCWKKLREVTWFFWDIDDKNVRVGVYAGRPANIFRNRWRDGDGDREQGGLLVEFEDLEIF